MFKSCRLNRGSVKDYLNVFNIEAAGGDQVS
jgi:hypothetical protein